MAELIGMPRAAWRRQPTGRLQPSALASQLGIRFLVNFAAYPRDCVANCPLYPEGNGYVPITGSSGIGLKSISGTTAGFYTDNNPTQLQFQDTTIFVVFESTGGDNLGALLYRSMGTGTPSWSAGVHRGSYNGYRVTVNGVTSDYIGFPVANDGVFGSITHCLVCSMGGDELILSSNRKEYPSGFSYSGGIDYSRTDVGIHINLAYNKLGTEFTGVLYSCGIFGKKLDRAESKVVALNYWQLFAPDPPRFYLIPSSGVITLIVQNASHGHAVESPSLTQAHVLALAESLHGQTVESPLLSQAYALTLAAAAHAHTVDAPGLTQAHSLSVAEASHPHSADNVSLFQAHILNLSDALHEHSVEAPVLTMAGSLLIDESYHGQTAEVPSLTQAHTITVQEASHGHSVEGLTLTQAYVLVPADSTHGHSSEAPMLSTELNLLVADALHSHTVEAPGLTQAHVLNLTDSLHGHSAEAVSMGQGYSLIVADASHNHSAESPTVSVAFVLAIQDALHSQAADQLALATHITLIVSDALHAHLAGTASEITLPTGDRIFLVAHEDRLFLVATEDRLFGV